MIVQLKKNPESDIKPLFSINGNVSEEFIAGFPYAYLRQLLDMSYDDCGSPPNTIYTHHY